LKGFYRKGNRKRKWKSYYPNGKLKSEGHYSKSMYYDSNNIVVINLNADFNPSVIKSNLKNHRRGVWKYYEESGELNRKEFYFNRKLIYTQEEI
jgi:antitoxin component YwqK of YwqJK toxin-antitoxin module